MSLLSGDQVQFEWAAGKGDQSLTVETSYRLDDNTWHSVLIEKNRKEAMVVIDGARKGIFPVIYKQTIYYKACIETLQISPRRIITSLVIYIILRRILTVTGLVKNSGESPPFSIYGIFTLPSSETFM